MSTRYVVTIPATGGTVNVFDALPDNVLPVYNLDLISVQLIHTVGGALTASTFTCAIDEAGLTNMAPMPFGAIAPIDLTNISAHVAGVAGYAFRLYTGDIAYLKWEITAAAAGVDTEVILVIQTEGQKSVPPVFSGTNVLDTQATFTGLVTVNQSAQAVSAYPAPVLAGSSNDLLTTLTRGLVIGGFDCTLDAIKTSIMPGKLALMQIQALFLRLLQE